MPRTSIAAISTLLALSSCAPATDTIAAETNANTVVSAYVAAYNARDLPGMVDLMHPDIEWISLEESKAIVFTSGVEALTTELEAHFARPISSTSQLSNWSTTGPYISVTETIRPEAAQPGDEAAASLSTYELKNDRIRRVWYYPAVNVTLE